ncbi:Trypanosoma vivax [Trypanosoma grayi]|uniref:Trypanosoma vivax n=1 Tax=Trypanosoma grayi TaxID=71804 RepID=UPI0004F49EF5|nr:Trypanosoma vivax [Trypanosoma grayi]KEG06589.1 Trypanosoma vivax [Trypanosoma grayi]
MRATAGDRPAEMPKDWWKKKPQPQQKEDGDAAEAERIVSVITVLRGQAPFYATSRCSVPYVRGFASTVPMPATVCARRVANLLP